MQNDLEKLNIIAHYDTLIEENNDPVRDSLILRDYMDKWDGQSFIDELQLSQDKEVLEIGIGTGRLAVKVAPFCKTLYGIDMSPKTIIRTKENLSTFTNVELICADFIDYNFDLQFDVIYSSLTFMHFKNKLSILKKIATLLKKNGIFVLSIDKNQSDIIDLHTRQINIYPDNTVDICRYLELAHMKLEKQLETELAVIFTSRME